MPRGATGGSTYRDTHTARTRDEPTPDHRAAAARGQRVRHGGHDGREDTTNTDRKGEGRQISELALEHRVVAKLGGQFGVVLGQVL